jgi:hypothetical protein
MTITRYAQCQKIGEPNKVFWSKKIKEPKLYTYKLLNIPSLLQTFEKSYFLIICLSVLLFLNFLVYAFLCFVFCFVCRRSVTCVQCCTFRYPITIIRTISIKKWISNLACRTRFWNNLHQIPSKPKYLKAK